MQQSKKRQDLIKVAKLYYYGNMSQEKIAEVMQLSRPKISRMLTEARQMNIVQITIKDDSNSCEEIALKLKNHYHLQDVIVVPTGTSSDSTKNHLAIAGSDYLNSKLTDDLKIGLAWGTTLGEFVKSFKAKRQASNGNVVQLIGGTYSQILNIDGRELVKELAQKLNSNHSILQAPLVVHNPKLRDFYMEEPAVVEHFSIIENLDMAIIGIGTSYYKESVIYQSKYITEDEATQLSDLGLTCDICGRSLTADGKCPDTFLTNRIIGIDLNQLHKIPNVVGVSGGSYKVNPIIATLNGKHINSLITDEITALTIIQQEHI